MPMLFPQLKHGIAGNTSGALATISTGTYLLAGGNNITLSQNSNTVTISAQSQSLQPIGTQTIGMNTSTAGGGTGGTSGSVTGTGVNYIFHAGSNITLSQSVNGSSGSLSIYAGAGGAAGSNTLGMSNLGNTVGTSGVVSGSAVQLLFAGGNNVTLSQSLNGVSGTITISGPNTVAQSQQPTISYVGMTDAGNTQFDIVGAYASADENLYLVGGNKITLAGFDDLAGNKTISISGEAYSNTFGMSNLGNTVGTSGVVSASQVRMLFAGGNNITLSQSLNGASGTITISAGAGGAAGSNTFGMSNIGNTSGTSGTVAGSAVRFVFAGGNNITLSQSLDAASVSGTITISAGAGAAGAPASYWDNAQGYVVGTSTQSCRQSTSHIHPFYLPYDISISHIRMPVTMSVGNTTTIATTNGATMSAGIFSTLNCVIYKQNTGASSLSLSSIASGSAGLTQQWSLSAAAATGSNWTLSQTVSFCRSGSYTSYTTQVARLLTNYSLGSLSLTLFTGLRGLDIPFATSLAASNYWFMYGGNSTTSTGGAAAMTNLRISCSNIAFTQANLTYGNLGEAYNASNQMLSGIGSFTTNAIGTTASLGRSNISSSASHVFPWFQFIRVT